MGRLFGTDGVRGLANRDVTAELALDLSVAAAHVLGSLGEFEGHRPRAIVGRDTRASGEFLAAAVSAGLASAGIDVNNVGVLPTPAVAFLTARARRRHRRRPVRVAQPDARQRHQVPVAAAGSSSTTSSRPPSRRAWARTGSARWAATSAASGSTPGAPASSTSSTSSGTIDVPLTGLRIAVDCANGAASEVGPATLRAAGADVVVINASPDGRNINEKCGSTHPEQLQAAVVASGADLGRRVRRGRRPVPRRRRVGCAGGRRPDHGDPRDRDARPRRPRGRHAGHHGDEQPRPEDRDDARPGSRRSTPRSATGTCSRRCAPAGTRSAASSPGTSSWRRTRPPATAC